MILFSSNTMKLAHKNFILMTALFLWLASSVSNAQFFNNNANKLLPEDEAFQMLSDVDGDTIKVNWIIAEGYYMYRDKFKIESNDPNIEIGELTIPQGVIENDPEFGEVLSLIHI